MSECDENETKICFKLCPKYNPKRPWETKDEDRQCYLHCSEMPCKNCKTCPRAPVNRKPEQALPKEIKEVKTEIETEKTCPRCSVNLIFYTRSKQYHCKICSQVFKTEKELDQFIKLYEIYGKEYMDNVKYK